MQPTLQVRWDGLSEDQIGVLERAALEMREAQRAAKRASAAGWEHLRRLWRNQQVARALQMAQVLDPELRDPGYLYLVAQTWDMLNQVLQGGNLVARTLNLGGEVVGGLVSLAQELPAARPGTEHGAGTLVDMAAELPQTGPRAAEQSAEVAIRMERVARGYERSAASLAPILLELLATGQGDPLGRLVFSRFAVLQAQVALNERRLHRLHRDAWDTAGVIWDSDLELRRMRLNLLGAAAHPAGRRICVRLISQRLSEKEEVVANSWKKCLGLGDTVLVLGRQHFGTPTQQKESWQEFSPELRALRIMLRLSELEVNTEQGGIDCVEYARRGR